MGLLYVTLFQWNEGLYLPKYHGKVKNYQEFESIFIHFNAWNVYYEITYVFYFTDLNIFKKILGTYTNLIDKYTLYGGGGGNKINSIGGMGNKDTIKIIIHSTEWNLYFNIRLLIHCDGEGGVYGKIYRGKIII